ncbi:MAG: hypothetical protein IKQ99_01255 [Alphaproteobacteria bacterium]|nr:hypothetical protein [Alphaproteobacteria bacterium]
MKIQSGRTMVEMLAVVCLISILTIMGAHLFAKAMNTLRGNYIMQQVFIKANYLIQNPVASRHKSLDVSVVGNKNKLSYGYSFDSDETKVDEESHLIKIQINGNFTKELCEVLKDKISSQEYAGLKSIIVKGKDLTKNSCPDEVFNSIKFVVSPDFKKQ